MSGLKKGMFHIFQKNEELDIDSSFEGPKAKPPSEEVQNGSHVQVDETFELTE